MDDMARMFDSLDADVISEHTSVIIAQMMETVCVAVPFSPCARVQAAVEQAQ